MDRINNIKEHLRKCYSLLKEWEQSLMLAENPKARLKCDEAINDCKRIIKEYEKELKELSGDSCNIVGNNNIVISNCSSTQIDVDGHKLKSYIAKGKTKNCIEEMLLLMKDTDFYSSIVNLSCQYHNWINSKMIGINEDKYEGNKINQALLALIDQFYNLTSSHFSDNNSHGHKLDINIEEIMI
jgi:hypothetical protein